MGSQGRQETESDLKKEFEARQKWDEIKNGVQVDIPKKRTFLGRIPAGSTKLTVIEKKEFKAYTRGFNRFFHGKDFLGNPIEHKVNVAYI